MVSVDSGPSDIARWKHKKSANEAFRKCAEKMTIFILTKLLDLVHIYVVVCHGLLCSTEKAPARRHLLRSVLLFEQICLSFHRFSRRIGANLDFPTVYGVNPSDGCTIILAWVA